MSQKFLKFKRVCNSAVKFLIVQIELFSVEDTVVKIVKEMKLVLEKL
jgi:hypothetical protein